MKRYPQQMLLGQVQTFQQDVLEVVGVDSVDDINRDGKFGIVVTPMVAQQIQLTLSPLQTWNSQHDEEDVPMVCHCYWH